jgi:ABC-2 type transport system ATP-binding protein
MLKISNLSISFGKQAVLNNLNLTLETGMVHGLVGLNGSGKSTLLNALFGFVKAQSGELLFNGAPLRREHIAFLETETYFYRNLSGREFLQLFQNEKFDAAGWASLLQLPLDELIEYYSTGMRKKLGLLAALKPDRPLMLLDEPYNGLDLEAAHTLQELLKRLRHSGKTLLVTSHILETLLPVCDRIHHLEAGKIVNSVQPEHFQAFAENLRERMRLSTLEALDDLAPQR